MYASIGPIFIEYASILCIYLVMFCLIRYKVIRLLLNKSFNKYIVCLLSVKYRLSLLT